MRLALVLVFALLALPRGALAHPAPFSYLDVRIGPNELSGRLVIHAGIRAGGSADPQFLQNFFPGV